MMDLVVNRYTPSPSEPKYSSKSQSTKLIENSSSRNFQINGFKKLNLEKELDDAGNIMVVSEIENLLDVNRDLKTVEILYNDMNVTKMNDEQMLTTLRTKDLEIEQEKFDYEYSSHLKGLGQLVEDYFVRNPKSFSRNSSFNNMSISSNKNIEEKNKKKINNSSVISNLSYSPKKEKNNSALENLYKTLGHQIYTMLIRIFEKYCFFGKTNTNFLMDFSQFSNFMSQNNLYDKSITKVNSELIFNKVKNTNKAITFEDFIIIIMEFSKLIYPWENNYVKSFSYYVHKFLVGIPCEERTAEEKNTERWYFYFENENFKTEIKQYIGKLYKIFNKYKAKDLKISECICTTDFIKMCKDIEIIPLFLTTKDVINSINYVKYTRKSLVPTSNFDYCSFVEVICLMALQSHDKIESDGHRVVDNVGKLQLFMKYIFEKI